MSNNIEIKVLTERMLILEFKLTNVIEAIREDESILDHTKEKLVALMEKS